VILPQTQRQNPAPEKMSGAHLAKFMPGMHCSFSFRSFARQHSDRTHQRLSGSAASRHVFCSGRSQHLHLSLVASPRFAKIKGEQLDHSSPSFAQRFTFFNKLRTINLRKVRGRN
jgi:hypothetical protein